MPTPPKWDETAEVNETPKFDGTAPVSFEDTVPEKSEDFMPIDPGHQESMIGDTGTRVTQTKIDELAAKWKVPKEMLERMMIRNGATYPDSTRGEKAAASVYRAGDNLLLNVPSWLAKKMEDDNGESAIEELKAEISKNKTMSGKVVDFAQKGVSPVFGAAGASAAAVIPKAQEGAGVLASLLSRFGKSSVQGAAGLGVDNMANSKNGEEAKALLQGGAVGAVGGPLIQSTLETAGIGGAKILGRDAATSKAYLADPKRYNNPDLTFENVEKMIAGPSKAGEAAEAELRAIADDATGAAKTAKQDYVQTQRDTRRVANDRAAAAEQNFRQSLDDKKVGVDSADAVDQALRQLSKDRAGLAGKQMEMLAGQNERHSLSGLDDILAQGLEREKIDGKLVDNENVRALRDFEKLINQFRPEGKPTVTQQTNPSTMQLEEIVTPAAREPAALKPQDLVKLRQQIDGLVEGTYDHATGAYSPRHERIAREMRSHINDVLKNQLPEDLGYQQVLSDLAAKSNLSGRAAPEFGGDKVIPKLASTANPHNIETLNLLKELDAATGKGIMPTLQQYMEAQALKANKPAMTRAIESLPESQARAAIEAKFADPRILEREVAALPASQQVGDAESFLAATQRDNQLYKEIGDPQSALRRAISANPKKPETELMSRLGELDARHGSDVTKQLDDLRVKQAFAGGSPNGSRLVNLGGRIGDAINSASGGAVPFMKPIMAAGGGLVDYTSGMVAKKMLDTAIAARSPMIRGAAVIGQSIMGKLTASPAGEKYAALMDKQAERGGPQAVVATHQTLLNTDPEYAALMKAQEPAK